MQNAHQIEAALAALPETISAQEAAKQGFLSWILSLSDNAQVAAHAALQARGDHPAASAAAGLFLDYLQQTACAAPHAPRRRDRRGLKIRAH